ncbi:MAG: FAD-dependent oxidoreductase [Patescibacteria group bacterium]
MPKYQYIIENNDTRPDQTLIITLKPKTNKDIFNFQPGQYAMLSFYDKAGKFFINHPFSIASSPTQKNYLKFGIKIIGQFTQNLKNLAPGNKVEVLGPFGNFIFDETKYPVAVFIAGGVGITPFMSAINYATDRNLSNQIFLLYSNRTIAGTLFYEEIKKLAAQNPHFHPQLKITQEPINNLSYCENGYITKETITKNIQELDHKDFFLCGPGQFMKTMEKNLIELGVPNHKIHQEAFNATPNLSLRENAKNISLVYGLTVVLFIFFLNFIQPAKISSANESAKIFEPAPINLINNAVNNRRNDIISSKKLLLSTISSLLTKNINTNTKPTAGSAPITQPAKTNPAPIIQPVKIATPIIKTPAQNRAPVVTPRTRVS